MFFLQDLLRPEPVIRKQDPLTILHFKVEIDGIQEASFMDVSGLMTEVEVEDHWEGGVNHHVHKLPKHVRQTNISLRKGLTDSEELWQWYVATIRALSGEGSLRRRSLSIVLYDSTGKVEQWRWWVEGAYPVKWTGPELKADGNAVAVETLEIAHNGVTSYSGPTR